MILDYYQKNDYIRNNIIKKILKNNCDDFINLNKRKTEPFKRVQMNLVRSKTKIKIGEKINKSERINNNSNIRIKRGINILFDLFNNIRKTN